MKASLCSPLRIISLFLVCIVAVTFYRPAVAKTRPPIEAGDPDIGNNKPLSGPGSAPAFMRASVGIGSGKDSIARLSRSGLSSLVFVYFRAAGSMLWR
jgi:hypothetical protein